MSTTRKPTRQQLEKFVTDRQSILALEGLFDSADATDTALAAAVADIADVAASVAAVKSFVAGDIVWSAATTRAGALLANGASKATADYPALFAAIGYTYGGSGANFNLPDITGRVVAGKEATATRLTSAGGGVDGATLGASGGVQTHTLTEAQMPAHDHSPYSTSDPGTHTHSQDANTVLKTATGTAMGNGITQTSTGGTTGGGGAHTHTVTATSKGSGSAHPNVQPTIILNAFIII